MGIDNELTYLFKLYGSDKIDHLYTDKYFSYLNSLKNEKLNILEIGIADGKSLLAWSDFFKNSTIIGIDIKSIDIHEKKLNRDNIKIHQGSQSDSNFIETLIQKYQRFDIIIDDGSHFPKDVIKSFKLLFNSLSNNGYYFIEDIQTSYIHFFGGNPFDLKYSNTQMNFFKNLTDSLNYQEIANPFYKKNQYDSKINNITFYHNLVVVKKGFNEKKSNLVLNNSYEDMRYLEKVNRSNNNIKYFIKYKIIFKFYTLLLFFLNWIKKIILLRF